MNLLKRSQSGRIRRIAVLFAVSAVSVVMTTGVGPSVSAATTAAPVPAPLATPALAALPSAPPPQSGQTASIRGWARIEFPAPGNDVQVSVDAHALFKGGSSYPERSWGTFRIYHRIEQPGQQPVVNWGDFEVDCLTTGGPTATVTGTLVRAAPGSPWLLGDRSGVSFYVPEDGSPGRVGLAGIPNPPLTPCMAPAADARVIDGGYSLTN